ncbi:MAG: endonuclease domain-containing protein [Anaerolineae bacterium]|nr:endonuclease domain-containing protein [Anaerolineae bacterium]
MTNFQKKWRASKQNQDRARELRKNMTSAEKKLWGVLRGKQLDGLYFRRQHPVGPYILDFFCAKGNLVIEVDGDSHLDQEEYDKERTRWLEKEKGYRVIRFTNDDIFKSIHEVIEAIRVAVNNPHLASPVSRGRDNSPPDRGGS